MKTVLLITNGFPPLIGGGVLRPSRLAKYLPDWGWHPIVLTMTAPATAKRLGEPGEKYAQDIWRTPRLDLTECYMIFRQWLRLLQNPGRRTAANKMRVETSVSAVAARPRLSSYLLLPDNRVLWIPGAVLAALWIVVRRDPAAIFSMAPDPSAHLAAWVVARLTGVRWVAEFRDPWVTNPFRCPRPFGWMERLEHWLEGRVVRDCDHLCVTSAEYKQDFLRRYPELTAGKISHIPNGFDPADFKDLVPENFSRFTILHGGNFYGARSASVFIAAYAELLTKRPELKENTQVVLVGKIDAAALVMLGESAVKNNVVLLGERTHKQSLRMICGADLLLLVPGPGKGTMPGKIYEYLRAGRPIYCLSNEGPTVELIRETGTGVTEASSTPDVVARSLEQMVDCLRQGGTSWTCSAATLRKYDRREIAGQIAAVLGSS